MEISHWEKEFMNLKQQESPFPRESAYIQVLQDQIRLLEKQNRELSESLEFSEAKNHKYARRIRHLKHQLDKQSPEKETRKRSSNQATDRRGHIKSHRHCPRSSYQLDHKASDFKSIQRQNLSLKSNINRLQQEKFTLLELS